MSRTLSRTMSLFTLRPQRLFASLLVLFCVILSGCATVIRSEVTTFHEWPTDGAGKTYAFQRSSAQENDLEYRNYENLVRAELTRVGLREAAPGQAVNLTVSVQYSISMRDVRVVEPVVVDPFYYGPSFGPRFGRGYYGPYGPFYDPFWYAPRTQLIERNYQIFTRRLRIPIVQTNGGKALYDVTVSSDGTNGSLATVMPYLVRSAFQDFPGQSGVPKVVDLKME